MPDEPAVWYKTEVTMYTRQPLDLVVPSEEQVKYRLVAVFFDPLADIDVNTNPEPIAR